MGDELAEVEAELAKRNREIAKVRDELAKTIKKLEAEKARNAELVAGKAELKNFH